VHGLAYQAACLDVVPTINPPKCKGATNVALRSAKGMLFNSVPFIFLFLPISLAGYLFLGARRAVFASCWLAAASLFFYGWWDIRYLPILLASIAFNYITALSIAATREDRFSSRILAFGIIVNLLILAYFKYAGFFIQTTASLSGLDLTVTNIILPLGISFFTFTQITYLVDAHNGEVESYSPHHFILFVTYFPHLIAGPLLHHREMIKQFQNSHTFKLNFDNIARGSSLFAIGLFKKVVLADGIATYVGPVFNAPSAGVAVSFIEAWGGALAYALQLYYDFSGYCDMAIGASLMFGIRLPLNFNSPYKATSVVDFWHRWHMTLSRFLRDYLYIPLGGNRLGTPRRYVNVLTTMLLGGLWHGAGWTFIVWGGLHGVFLAVNHAWRSVRGTRPPLAAASAASWVLTFLCVVISWVFFRADSLGTAGAILQAMSGMNGVAVPTQWAAFSTTVNYFEGWLFFSELPAYGGAMQVIWLSSLLAIALILPNSQELILRVPPSSRTPLIGAMQWRPSPAWALAVTLLAWTAFFEINRASEFLYFAF
jgi:alginate O-acetyltransferase complex protein AlgI